MINFARSVVLGILFCLIYDIFRAFRKVIKYSPVSIFFQDLVYSLAIAFVTFTFLLSVTNGELRGFVFVGIGIGFIISRVSLSIVIVRFFKLVISIIYGLFSKVSKRFYTTFDRLIENICEFSKKSGKDLKKLLKNVCKLLYTKEDRKV